ncbi:MAG: flagellar motor switch protein FliN [Polyangiaceae bacterium]|nr:flagellar motor switch protein FliN [Polyangiaceae bacterium]
MDSAPAPAHEPEPAPRPPARDPARASVPEGIEFVMDVPVEVTVEIGRRTMRIAELLRLGSGSVLELDKTSGEPLDVYVNDRLIARGEAVVVGERYGVRLTEVLVGDDPHRGSGS